VPVPEVLLSAKIPARSGVRVSASLTCPHRGVEVVAVHERLDDLRVRAPGREPGAEALEIG
jgi:hypothetical protein